MINSFIRAFRSPILVIASSVILYAVEYPDKNVIEIFSSRAILTTLLVGYIVLWSDSSRLDDGNTKGIFEICIPLCMLGTFFFLMRETTFFMNFILALSYVFFATYTGVHTMTSARSKENMNENHE